MTRRTADWNKGLARDLRSAKFAPEYIRAALDEGESIQLVLGKVIRAYGVKEFASRIRMPSSNLVRAINPKSNPTLDTLNRLLKPFSLEVAVAPVSKRRVA